MGVRKDLTTARALIDTPEKWIKGALRDSGRYCALGAAYKAAGVPASACSTHIIEKSLNTAAHASGYSSIVSFNDHSGTTHADVMALFDRAIEAAK